MSFNDELEAALSAYDEAKEQRSTATGDERVALDAKLTELAEEVRAANVRAEEERAIEEVRAKSPIHTPRFRTETRGNTEGEELRSLLVNGGTKEFRAVNAGAGHNYANGEFVSKVLQTVQLHNSVLLAGAELQNDNSGNRISAMTVDPIVTGPVTEGNAYDDSTTGTAMDLGAYDFGGIVRVSKNLATDAGSNIVNQIAAKGASAIVDHVGGYLLTGTGSSQPQGALVGSTKGRDAAAAALSDADIYALFYSLPNSAQNSGAWIMHGTTAANLRTSASNLWEASPAVDEAGRLLGRPIYTDSNMPLVGAGLKSVLFGDFANGLYVRQVGGIEVTTDVSRYFEYNQVGVRVLTRLDSKVVEPRVLKHILHAAS